QRDDPRRDELGVGQLLRPLLTPHDDRVRVVGVGGVDRGDRSREPVVVHPSRLRRPHQMSSSSTSTATSAARAGRSRAATSAPSRATPATTRHATLRPERNAFDTSVRNAGAPAPRWCATCCAAPTDSCVACCASGGNRPNVAPSYSACTYTELNTLPTT